MGGLKEKNQEDRKFNEETIAGINVIGAIVEKGVQLSEPTQILSAIKQVCYFYRLLPKNWREKASTLFQKLWNKNKVIISTEPEKPERIYETCFDDDKLNKLSELLPQIDQAIMLQGKAMIDLIKKGLHGHSDEIKKEVEKRYGIRGLNIVNILTTKDIQYLLEEITEPVTKDKCEKVFNEWGSNYDSLALLVSPAEIEKKEVIEQKIIDLAKNNIKNYILINLSGKISDCTSLLEIIEELKTSKKLKYTDMKHDISDSGFCKSLNVKLNFKS